MLLRSTNFAILFVFVDVTLGSIANGTVQDVNNKLDVEAINQKIDKDIEIRRYNINEKKGRKDRSTSSSSGERTPSSEADDTGESLKGSSDSSSSSGQQNNNKKYHPKSSEERKGWKKWHRKCTPCPRDMAMKWRDERIDWVCGAYQRARRSFKSMCLMRYRNCQDGTMFVRIHDRRCKDDDPKDPSPHGDHFFYDYKVKLSKDTSSKESDSVMSTSVDSDSYNFNM